MKTKKQWDGSGMSFEKFLGDIEKEVEIDFDLYVYFLGVVPPARRGSGWFLCGEAYKHNENYEKLYMAFSRMEYTDGNQKYYYKGLKTIKDIIV